MNKVTQLALEQNYSNTYTSDYLKYEFKKAGKWFIVEDIADSILAFAAKTPPENRPDMVEVHKFYIELGHEKIMNMVWKMISGVLVKGSLTAAALAGMVFHSIKLENHHRVFLAIEYLLTMIDASPLVYSQITKGEECLFLSYGPLPDFMLDKVKAQGYPLPMVTRPRAHDNNSIGYMTFNESVLAGDALKSHDMDIVLSSVNRANAVPYTTELRLREIVEFTFNAEPKVKDSGLYETREDIVERYEDYVRLKASIDIKLDIMAEQGNVFHLAHRVDNRIRRYAKGYEFNYQSNKYVKSIVQFAEGETIVPEW